MKSTFRVGALSGLSKNLQLKILSKVITNQDIEISLEGGDASILVERLVSYKLDALLTDVALPQSVAEPLLQTEIARETVCFVSRKMPEKSSGGDLTSLAANGIYLPAQSSPMTSALLEVIQAEIKHPHIRGFIDDIVFLRLLALETDSLVAIPKIGVRREIEAKELHIIHEFKKIKQTYFLAYRQKGKRHPMLSLLLRN